jgi:hypothetical protein
MKFIKDLPHAIPLALHAFSSIYIVINIGGLVRFLFFLFAAMASSCRSFQMLPLSSLMMQRWGLVANFALGWAATWHLCSRL